MSSLSEFGTRKLENEEDVFEHNAWDNVEFDEEMLENAKQQIQKQKESKLEEDKVQELDQNPNEFWNQFYSKNANKFFKDRHWLKIEFPELFEENAKARLNKTIVELGCGAGNTVFPFLQERPDAFVYAFDYSSEAVNVVKGNELYDTEKCKAMVYDITSKDILVEKESIDVVVCIFVLSAINPRDWKQASENIFNMLKPGGLLLFRDYGRYDLAQLRMKKKRLLDDNFYCRGDGTRCYFFTNKELTDIFSKFEQIQNGADKRLLVNRSKKLKMYRNWVQAKFKKPIN
ncbi:hypothetical protein HDV06_006807 [Boothiomyces sp. JEL0866]|nr:hypothetical protein HDV06_006807 [Boothiomyces sp. JEL0866]